MVRRSNKKAGDEKETGGAKSQIDHGQQAALKPLKVQGKQADDDEPKMADAAERQQTPEVWLDQATIAPYTMAARPKAMTNSDHRRVSSRHPGRKGS